MNALTTPFSIQLTKFEHGIIHRKVDILIGRDGFTDADRRSLQHDLTIRLIQSLKSFDPKKADRKSFSTMVVERSVAKILRYQRAEKRDCRRVQSLNAPIPCSEGLVELGETIGTAEYDARRGCTTPCPNRQAEVKHDVNAVIAGLTPELRKLAELLKTRSVRQAAQEMNVSRYYLTTLVSELREVFEKNNFQFYL